MSRELDLLDKSISPRRMVLLLTWPTMIEQLLQIMVNYVDTAMVGSIGVQATASIAVVTSTVWVIGGLMMGLGVGFSVLSARYIGNREIEEAKEVVRQSLICMLLVGAALTVIVEFLLAPNISTWMGADESIKADSTNYFRIIGSVYVFDMFLFIGGSIIRSAGNTKSPMVYNIINNVVNIIGNFIFIYKPNTYDVFGMKIHVWGAGLGVEGAAIGTVMGAVVAGSLMLSGILNKNSLIAISLKDKYVIRWDVMKEVLFLGIPASMERIIISGGQLVVTGLATGLGTSILAAHQLANTAESICYMPVFAFGLSATTLVAQSLGSGDKVLARKYAHECIGQGVCLMLVSAVLLYTFAPQLMSIFIRDTGVIAAGAAVLRIQAFAEPCVAIATVVSGVLRGSGDTKGPFYIAIVGMWVVRITMAFIMIRFFGVGLEGIWIPMACDWTARAVICLLRMKSGRWLSNWDVRKKEED